MKKSKTTYRCPTCGKEFQEWASQIKGKEAFCSKPCMYAGIHRRAQSAIETRYGKPIKQVLQEMYDSGKGIKKISKELGISDSTCWIWFDALGIERRNRSDAVKTQWVNNDARRSLTATIFGAFTRKRIADGTHNKHLEDPEIRKKISDSKKGEKNAMYGKFGEQNHNWKGGKITYRGAGWKSIMVQARRRDGEKCVKCGSTKQLEVHHIVPYRFTQNNSLENLITLCHVCHTKAEKDSYSIRSWRAKLKQLKLF